MYGTLPIYDTIRSYILPNGLVCNVFSFFGLLFPTFIILFGFHINNPGLIQARFTYDCSSVQVQECNLRSLEGEIRREDRAKLRE